MSTKFVDYSFYCPKCKHRIKDEHEEPCDSCLAEPVNDNSEKPIHYEPNISQQKHSDQ